MAQAKLFASVCPLCLCGPPRAGGMEDSSLHPAERQERTMLVEQNRQLAALASAAQEELLAAEARMAAVRAEQATLMDTLVLASRHAPPTTHSAGALSLTSHAFAPAASGRSWTPTSGCWQLARAATPLRRLLCWVREPLCRRLHADWCRFTAPHAVCVHALTRCDRRRRRRRRCTAVVSAAAFTKQQACARGREQGASSVRSG